MRVNHENPSRPSCDQILFTVTQRQSYLLANHKHFPRISGIQMDENDSLDGHHDGFISVLIVVDQFG